MKFSLMFVSALFLASVCHAEQIRLQVKGPDGKPIVGAKVRVVEGKLGWRQQNLLPARDFTSDDQGSVAFESRGAIALSPSILDSAHANLFARIIAPGLATGAVQLQGGDNTIVLSEGHSLEGVALDTNEKPLANVRLQIETFKTTANTVLQLPGELALEAKSDAQGHWKFEGLPQKGLVDVQVEDARFKSETFSLDLGLKAPPLFLEPGATLKGRLLRPDGSPAAKVRLAVWSTPGLSQTPVTDADGRFTVAGLGNESVSVQSAGTDKSLPFLVQPQQISNLEESEIRDVGDWKAIQGVRATGKVMDAKTHKPVSGANVSIWGHSPITSFDFCDKNGAFDMIVAPQPFLMSVNAPGYMSFSKRGISLPQNGLIAMETIALQGACRAKGVVVDEAGTPMTSVSVYAEKEVSRANSSTRTDAKNGTFILDTLESGKYSLKVQGFKVVAGATFTSSTGITPSLRIVVEGKAGRVQTLDVPFKGRAVDGEGRPVAGVKVAFRVSSGMYGSQVKSAVSQSDGSFALDALAPTGKLQWMRTMRPGYLIVQKEVGLQEDGWHANLTLLKRGGTLKGHVVDTKGQPVMGAFVGLQNGDELPVRVDDKGAFTLLDVPSKGVTLLASNGPSLAAFPVVAEGQNMEIVLPDAQPLDNKTEVANTLLQNARLDWDWPKIWRVIGSSRLETMMKGKASVWAWTSYLDALAHREPASFLERQSELQDAIPTQNRVQFDRLLLLCKAVAGDETQKGQVRHWLGEQEKEKRTISPESVQRLLEISEIAARLDPKSGASWLDYATGLNAQLDDKIGSDNLAVWGALAARIAPDATRTLSQDWNPAAQIEIFAAAMSTWRRDKNLKAARQNWETIRALAVAVVKKPDTPMRNGDLPQPSSNMLNEIRSDYAQLLASTDPQGALDVVLSIDTSELSDSIVYSRPDLVLTIARAAVKQEQLGVARGALENVFTLRPRSVEAIAGSAKVAEEFDAALAASLWSRAYLSLRPHSPYEMLEEPVTVAPYAQALASKSPGASRILIEREWARRSQIPDQPNLDRPWNEDMASYSQSMMGELASAMAALSPARAIEMANGVTSKQETRASTQTEIALSLLQSQPK